MHDSGHRSGHRSPKHGSHEPHGHGPHGHGGPGTGHHAHGDHGHHTGAADHATGSGTYTQRDVDFLSGEGCPKRGGTAECPGDCGTCPNH